MKYYHVYTDTIHMDLVKAHSADHAIKIIEHIYGPASKYHSKNQYKAVEA